MRYLIDGYNLAHALHLLVPASLPRQVERARVNLLDRLARSPERGIMTVVFDALGAPRGVPTRSSHHDIEVRFARDGTADDLIEELLEAGRRGEHTVVSDDRRLQKAARRHGCQALGCFDFVELLSREPTPEPPAAPQTADDRPATMSESEKAEWARVFGALDD